MPDSDDKITIDQVDPQFLGVFEDDTYTAPGRFIQGVGIAAAGGALSSGASNVPGRAGQLLTATGAGAMGLGLLRTASAFQSASQAGQPSEEEGKNIKENNLLPIVEWFPTSEFTDHLEGLANPFSRGKQIEMKVTNQTGSPQGNLFAGWTFIPPTGEVWNVKPQKFSVPEGETRTIGATFPGPLGVGLPMSVSIMINQFTDTTFNVFNVVTGKFEEYRGEWQVRYSIWNKYPGDDVPGLVRISDTGMIRFDVN